MLKLRLKYWQWILIAVFCIYFTNLGVLYINLMETRNMVTAREMVNLHHWIFTTLDNIPRYEKPPLPTWITALFGEIFGFKSFVVMRLPAALMSLLIVWMVYKFGPLLKIRKKQAFIAALVMASTFYLIFSGRTNQWDVYTHAFMMVSLYYLWKFLTDSHRLQRNILLSAVFFGFAFMSKGPISLYTLWLPFLFSYGITYKYQNLKRKIGAMVLFLIVGFGIGLWWFIYIRLMDPGYFTKMLAQESSRWGNYNTRPWYYYWNFFLQTGVWSIPALLGLFWWYLKDKVSNRKAYKFTLLWTIFSVILLSLVPEKKPRYLLPALIPLAINTSFYIDYLFRKFKALKPKENGIVYFYFGLIGLIGIAFPFVGYFLLDLKGKFWIWYITSSIALLSLGIAIFYFLIKRKDFPKVFYLTVVMIAIIMTLVFPLTNSFIKNPQWNSFSNLHKTVEKEGFDLYEYGEFAPQIIWEYGTYIPQIDYENPEMPQEKEFGILVHPKDTVFVNKLLPQYKILKRERFDVNYVPKEKHSYKNWLVRYFYLLKEQ